MKLCPFWVVVCNVASMCAPSLLFCVYSCIKSYLFFFFLKIVSMEMSTDTAICLVKSNVLMSIND